MTQRWGKRLQATSIATLTLLVVGGAAVAGLGATAASASPAPARVATVRASDPASTCPGGASLGLAAGYSEFSFGDADRGQPAGVDDEGNVAVGGNATFDNFYVGSYTGSAYALEVGGNITVDGALVLQSGSKGSYGGTINTPVVGLTKGTPPFSFTTVEGEIDADSTAWAAETTTAGDTIGDTGGPLLLTGTNPTLNVFDLKAGDFAAAQTIRIDVPVGSTTLVNVPDASLASTDYNDIQYWDGSAWETGDQYDSAAVETIRDSTLFNFPSATTINISSASVAMTVVAPHADFTLDNGRAVGSVIADSVNGDFQAESVPPFQGCQPPAQTISGVIYECINGATTTTVVPGGTLTTPGVLGGAAQPNPLATTSVDSGNYTMTATPPADWALTACGTTDTSPESITVPPNGTGEGIFYVQQLTQTISGVIYECINGATTTTVVPGGTLTTPGVLGGAAQPNPLATTPVASGTYTMTATPPTGWVLTACGTKDTSPESVTVPDGGTGEGIFYVEQAQSISGVIYECINGATTTTVVPGGTLTTPGVLGGAAEANPLAATPVAAGTYTMTATAPSGWELTACGTKDTSPESVVVPTNGDGEGIFYVTAVSGPKTAPGSSTTTTAPTSPATSTTGNTGGSGGLAFTGAVGVVPLVATAGGLILGGGLLVGFRTRRRRRSTI